MRGVAVLTSGGDSPGMNAAIRSVVRSGIDLGWSMYGVANGYRGLVDGAWRPLTARDVGGYLQNGGTLLGSSRCPEFKQREVRLAALERLGQAGIDSLVIIGGNGTQTGADQLHQEGFPVVGVASTIDNDLFGVDITLGVDTALNIALEAIDRLKQTASSHRRAFLVEVMGRDCGYLGLMAAIAGGAEAVVVPEFPMSPQEIADVIAGAYKRGKPHALVVVAEGAAMDATALVEHFKTHRESLGFALRATILGHVQRGGNPTAFDRILGTQLGWGAIQALRHGETGCLIGSRSGQINGMPYEEIRGQKKLLDPDLVRMAQAMTL